MKMKEEKITHRDLGDLKSTEHRYPPIQEKTRHTKQRKKMREGKDDRRPAEERLDPHGGAGDG